jgi:L-ribulose-5-phosphate 3-epimerase
VHVIHGVQDWTVETCLTHLTAQGFHHFELALRPGFLWPGDMDKTGYAHFRRFLAGHRLRIVSIDTAIMGFDIASSSADTRAVSLELIERCIDLGGGIGAKGIVIDIGKADPLSPPQAEQLAGHLFRALDRLGPVAVRAGTALWVENTPLAWESKESGLMQLLADYGDDRIGVVYDVAAGWFIKEDLGAALRAAAPRLKLVRLVGLGALPFYTLPPLLAEIGYADWLVVEIGAGDPIAAVAAQIDTLLQAGFGDLTALAASQD